VLHFGIHDFSQDGKSGRNSFGRKRLIVGQAGRIRFGIEQEKLWFRVSLESSVSVMSVRPR
jgi:hypothetical protein